MNILHLQNNLNITCGVTKTIYLILKNSHESYTHYLICLGGDGIMRFDRIGHPPIVLKNSRSSILILLAELQKQFI